MATRLSLLVVALLALQSAQAAHQIPSSWGTCQRSDANFDECLRGAMQKAMTELEKGNSEFGVLPLDPFNIEQLRLDKGGGGALSIDMTFSDIALVGLKDAKVESVQSDLSKYKITAVMRTPNLDLNSKYKVLGRVLLIPINGNGRTIIKMEKPLMKLTMQGHMKKGKNGKDHLHIDNVDFEIVPEKSNFQFINPAHATQAGLLSRVVSENDKVIMQDLQPAISEAFSQAITQIANRIFDKVAFEDAFPQ